MKPETIACRVRQEEGKKKKKKKRHCDLKTVTSTDIINDEYTTIDLYYVIK